MAKEIGKNSAIALELFDTEIYEARLLCSKVFHPKDLTEDLMEEWIKVFDNWEICDSFCMTVFARSTLAVPKIRAWSNRKKEFERRASFATMAAYCMADKKADNEVFISFFPLIVAASDDNRNFVKKAVSWALRGIGKRNKDLQKLAIDVASDIAKLDGISAQWIAKDVLKELESDQVRISDYPRSIYRP